jgi:asparagine synthase (glutamine-hydrolysing)
MANAIAHRGPDGEGFYFEPGLAMAHRRLAIIDLSTGEQPMTTQQGDVHVVFNGEIYNYRELRHSLIQKGHIFRTRSDTEVILRSWLEWQDACVVHLQGMFAFALWDRNQRILFLARDRLGEKPLYYAHLADETLIFGSELKALTIVPSLNRKLDPRAIEDFFALGYVADPRTIYRDVVKLEAGTTLTLPRGGAPRISRYWDPKPMALAPITLDDAATAVRERLSSAVRSQLIADVPVGCFLSGGVDSSAITSFAAKLAPDTLSAFTIGFNDSRFDERAVAASVAQHTQVRQYVDVVEDNDITTVNALPHIFDEPFGDSSALPTYHLARLARRHVKVALSGDGGDELFAGYRRYAFHSHEESLRRIMPYALRHPLFSVLGHYYPQLDWAPRLLRARQTLKELSLNTAEGYFQNLVVVDDETRARLFSPLLRRAISNYRASDLVASHMARAPGDDPLCIAQYVDLKTWLVSDILTKVDRTAMSCGLEVRVPMLDPDFVNFALGLPRALKLRRGQTKRVLKRSLEHLVPNDVLYRPKKGFSVPLATWFCGPLGDNFSRQIDFNAELLQEYFNLDFIRDLLQTHRSGWRDNSRTLWLLWMFLGFLTINQSSETFNNFPELGERAFAHN